MVPPPPFMDRPWWRCVGGVALTFTTKVRHKLIDSLFRSFCISTADLWGGKQQPQQPNRTKLTYFDQPIKLMIFKQIDLSKIKRAYANHDSLHDLLATKPTDLWLTKPTDLWLTNQLASG